MRAYLLGMSPFMAAKGFQRPVFPVQEEEVAVPTVQEHLRCIKEVWGTINASVYRSGVCVEYCSLQHQTTDLVSRFDKLSEPLPSIHQTVYGGQGDQPHNFQVRITTIPEH